jgi:CRISPR-associated protein Csm2
LANEFSQIPSSKLRKFYDYVLKIYENKNSNWYVELYRLKSFIAYNIGKETSPRKKNALKKFSKIFEKLIDEIDGDDEKFDNFKIFFESVVAYHRAYNEK